MYRLLIVDDESIIVDGLTSLFQEIQHLSLEVIGAYSPLEALDWLSRTRIDIVLCDIEMPGMNGLELHRKILRQWPSCKVVFLSGHDDFSYIQEAIRNNSIDYVLKTEGDDAIIRAVETAIDYIVEDRNVHNIINSANEKMRMAMPFLLQELLVWLLNGESMPTSILKDKFTELRIPLNPSYPVFLVVAQLDDWNIYTSVQERSSGMFAVQNIADECLERSARLVSIVYERNRIVWMIQPIELCDSEYALEVEEQWTRNIRFVKGTLETIQEICLNSMQESVSFVAADNEVEWNEISARFKALKRIMLQGTVVSRQLLLTESHFPTTTSEKESYIKQEWLDRDVHMLKTYLGAGQRQESIIHMRIC